MIRGDLGGLALVFANLTDWLPNWKLALTGWNMRESSIVQEWLNQERTETMHRALKTLLETRFGSLPLDLATRIDAVLDLDRLEQLFKQAITINRPEDLLF